MSKVKKKDVIKLHDLVMSKLDKAMMSVEASKDWKKIKSNYDFTLVISMVVEECLYRWLEKSCIHEVKDRLTEKLQRITSHRVIQAKADREEATLN